MSETETLDGDSIKVAALLHALPRVEAPANFEFGVKARIAAGGRRSGWNLFPFFKVAAPLALVLLVVASVMFYGTFPSDNSLSTVAVVVPERTLDSQPAPEPVKEKRIDVPVPAPTFERAGSRMSRAAAEPHRSGPVRVATPVRPKTSLTGGSTDTALTNPEVIMPPGFETNPGRNPNSNANVAGDTAGIPIQKILETLGLNVKLASGAWMVQSVRRESLGDRSGVQVNDVIEALGDHVLGAGTTLKGGFDVKTLRIRREGKPIRVVVKN